MPVTQKKACLSCRERKLKCDKQQPCANCITRTVECKEQLVAPVSRGVKRTLDESDQISHILSRLDRLEAYTSTTHNNHHEGLVLSSFAKEVNTVRNSVSAVTSASTADTSTARNAQSATPEFGVPLGQLSATDNILVCLDRITITTFLKLTVNRAKHWCIIFSYLSQRTLQSSNQLTPVRSNYPINRRLSGYSKCTSITSATSNI